MNYHFILGPVALLNSENNPEGYTSFLSINYVREDNSSTKAGSLIYNEPPSTKTDSRITSSGGSSFLRQESICAKASLPNLNPLVST